MSRLIVKNLPKNITEDRLYQHFSIKGHITDCSLKYTKEGVFRKFAFIGFRNEEDCTTAINYFNNTFIDTSKIQVCTAFNFGDENKPRAWSKYSKDSSYYQNQSMNEDPMPLTEKREKDKKKKDKEEKMKGIIGDLSEDPEFLEFLEAHKISGSGNKKIWSNDAIEELKKTYNSQMNKGKNSKSSNVVFDDSGNDSADEEYQDMVKDDAGSADDEVVTHIDKKAVSTPPPIRYSVRVKGLTGRYNSVILTEFFYPLKVKVVNIPQGPNHRRLGIAFVEFHVKEDIEKALKKNEGFINGQKVVVKKCKVANDPDEDDSRPWERKSFQPGEEEEDLAESGRLFVRNLSYSCTEEDLEKLFGRYGNLTEVHLPVDSLTKKPKGFAFITYMIPENAVNAYSELDGSAFQGRMLHLLPSLMKTETEGGSFGKQKGSSYKLSKLQKQKEQSSSSHNWNSLFLGPNVVADIMAEKYNMDKSEILDPESRESLGVRMALGETQIVTETRNFLIENGVCLDSFSQAAVSRSKNVILVKNLPAATKPSEICKVFSHYGTVGRVVLPPSGITAIVEFLSQSEAKRAFTNLAYTKFLHVPLYLEWAPMDTFTTPTPSKEDSVEDKTTEVKTSKEKDESSDSDSDIEPESVVFVKNLNFDTTETTLKEEFEKCGPVRNVIVARKKDLKNKGQMLSMGYGFVEYKRSQSAFDAMKKLQHMEIDGHQVELKISNRVSIDNKTVGRKKQEKKKQKTSKILVRNIAFQATKKEIKELFSAFGELKIVRLPKKLVGTGPHRGFGFVDFVSRHDAKRAFNALCHSTHLYGRRLVLEWADTEQSIDELRKKTAEHFYEDIPKKKVKKANIMADLKGETVD